MKGFLYPLLILLFTNQTSAQRDERERLCCLDVRPLVRMRDPREPKSEVERCCFWVSCHFSSCFSLFQWAQWAGTIQGARTRAALPFNADGLQEERRKILLISEGRFFVSESLINQRQHPQTKAAGEETEKQEGRESGAGREGRERMRGRESWLSCGRDDATS